MHADRFRATRPERFRPLHDAALALIARLESLYDVHRGEDATFADEAWAPLSRPAIVLAPRSSDAAPLLVALTTFPGLIIRPGRWHIELMPVCGCDACPETAESEIDRLHWLTENVVSGRFREAITLPLLGAASRTAEWGAPGTRFSRSGWRLTRAEARRLAGKGRRAHEWRPWPRRASAT